MRRLRSEDAALWHRAMRNVAPLPGRARRDLHPQAGEGGSEQSADRAGVIAGERPAVPGRPPRAPPPPPPLDAFAGVDRATAERLKRGQRAIEARLDLHGMTQADAHRALAGFVLGSRAAGRRCVLVITGHGRTSGGVLKHAVPRWLNEPDLRRHLLAIAPARPQHGGSGALYLLLRKER